MNEMNIRSGLSDEERKRLEKIDRLDSNQKRKKLILFSVTAILIIFFVIGTVFGGIHVLSYEGTMALPVEQPEYTPLPQSEDKIISEFNSLLADTENFAGVKLDVSYSVDISDDSIVLSGDKADVSRILIDHVKSSAVALLRNCYTDENYSGTYGEDFSEYLFDNDFTTADAVITSKVNEDDNNKAQFIFSFDGCSYDDIENHTVSDVFGLDVSKKTIDYLKERFCDIVNIKDADISFEGFIMTADISRLENRLDRVEQKRICNVTLPLEFIGEWEDLGQLTLSFKVELSKIFSFTRVELFFRDDVYYIEKGASDEFKTKVITDQSPSEIVVEIFSSDPSVLSVDKGFYKGEKVSPDPVTVTAVYTYKGVTYEDTCLFYVRVPVEGVKVNKKEISLKEGESFTMGAVLTPDDATLTEVYWFSSDESIAEVNEDGVITALRSGLAEVWCITLDGNYKSSCKVNIEG